MIKSKAEFEKVCAELYQEFEDKLIANSDLRLKVAVDEFKVRFPKRSLHVVAYYGLQVWVDGRNIESDFQYTHDESGRYGEPFKCLQFLRDAVIEIDNYQLASQATEVRFKGRGK